MFGFLKSLFAGPPPAAGPPTKVASVAPGSPLTAGAANWEGDAIRLTAASPGAVRLLELPLDRPDACRLELRFTLATENLRGAVYPELRVAVEGAGEAFSKGLKYQLKGTNGAIPCALPFDLKPGRHGTKASLMAVFGGAGTGAVTVVDVELWSAPLKP